MPSHFVTIIGFAPIALLASDARAECTSTIRQRTAPWRWWAAILFTAMIAAGSAGADQFDASRNSLLAEIQKQATFTGNWTGRPGFSPETMAAMRRVPRHLFVPVDLIDHAYENRPLPIGYGQTISQPYIVALMTDLLDLSGEEHVLEVGTGSGYQAAVAAEIADHVYTIEIIRALADPARDRLNDSGLTNVTVRWADGYHGWPKHAPFDAIIVTAAADHIPPPLVQQLKPRRTHDHPRRPPLPYPALGPHRESARRQGHHPPAASRPFRAAHS